MLCVLPSPPFKGMSEQELVRALSAKDGSTELDVTSTLALLEDEVRCGAWIRDLGGGMPQKQRSHARCSLLPCCHTCAVLGFFFCRFQGFVWLDSASNTFWCQENKAIAANALAGLGTHSPSKSLIDVSLHHIERVCGCG